MGPFFIARGTKLMDENLQEFVSSRGVDVQVEAERGIIRGVKLLGLESRNGRRYLPAALREAAALYEGAKVNVNHPKGSPLAARDYQDRLGSIRNLRAGPGGLFGDLHFNPKHALAEQLAWDALHAPENVGFSHNVEARTSRSAGRTVVEAILKVHSVDLVADPATTRSLYESAAAAEQSGEQLAGLSLDELRAARPDLVETIRAESSAELFALREELDRLQAREAARQRRAAAVALLREFNLPDPELAGAGARPIVSELFVETLMAAPDERAMRRLVQERAELIAATRRLDSLGCRASRPVSREQHRSEPAPKVLDGGSFARAIS
jgi:hypothetical protein